MRSFQGWRVRWWEGKVGGVGLWASAGLSRLGGGVCHTVRDVGGAVGRKAPVAPVIGVVVAVVHGRGLVRRVEEQPRCDTV